MEGGRWRVEGRGFTSRRALLLANRGAHDLSAAKNLGISLHVKSLRSGHPTWGCISTKGETAYHAAYVFFSSTAFKKLSRRLSTLRVQRHLAHKKTPSPLGTP